MIFYVVRLYTKFIDQPLPQFKSFIHVVCVLLVSANVDKST